MTQQELIDELNHIVVGYNITWYSVKNDMDRAIMKINSYLGATYPKISDIMLSPMHRYTLRVRGVEVPIFPERYLLTVVVPFVASEVLARDEEFTTIYNKYVLDYENGLFDMFQNEYNRVPEVFRQKNNVGVFFSTDVPEHNCQTDLQLPTFVFSVQYHINNKKVVTEHFTRDLSLYEYGMNAIILDSNIDLYVDNIDLYRFKGWSLNPDDNIVQYYKGDSINVTSDVHLYACWDTLCALTVDNYGVLDTNKEYAKYCTVLVIPEYIKGKSFNRINSNFLEGLSIKYVSLPKASFTIASEAFANATVLEELIFPKYDYLRGYPEISIEADSISGTSISHLYIPYSVKTIGELGVSGVPSITCEVEEDNAPEGWVEGWTDATNITWGVANG